MFNCKKLLITSFIRIKRNIVRENCERKALNPFEVNMFSINVYDSFDTL